jgi:hypothetical protein
MITPGFRMCFDLFPAAICTTFSGVAQEVKGDPKPALGRWIAGTTFHWNCLGVNISAPVVVAEGKKTDILCMPTITKLANGEPV